jgi:hypothetical protein
MNNARYVYAILIFVFIKQLVILAAYYQHVKYMKIELTQEQIDLLTKDAEKKLTDECNAAKDKLEKKLQEDIAALKGKFRYADVSIAEKEMEKPVQKKQGKRVKIDTDKLNELFAAGKTYQQVAEFFGTSANSIRSKVNLLKKKNQN